MKHYNYLIVGGGMTADAALRGIREIDSHGTIGVISSESDPPYDRPPLTKGLWKDKPLDSIWRHTENEKADLHLGRTVSLIDPRSRLAFDTLGESYSYRKLLLATGGSPRRLPIGEGINYFRTLADYRRLRQLADKGRKFAVLGGGFIGSELAAALAMNGKEVVMVFRGNGICDRVFPPDLSNFVTNYYSEKKVQVFPRERVSAVERRGEKFLLRTESKREFLVDGIVAGIGITPNDQIAREGGLATDNGIIVDEELRTSSEDIYAAGDVASFYNSVLGKRMRVEHEDNAKTMGRVAGRNMAGASEPYHHLPFFYSDLFDHGYEAVGELDARYHVTADWKVPNQEGVLFYEKDQRIRGVLLWNVWGKVDAARELIGKARSRQPIGAAF